MRDELTAYLDGAEKDGAYAVVDVLKENGAVTVEKVNRNGRLFVRKAYSRDGCAPGEVRLLSALRHASLPVVHETYELADRVVIVEEFIEGLSLTEFVKRQGPLPLHAVFRLAEELCGAADYLHTRTPPVIHRDIKPDHVLITPDGAVKLIDFNIARTYGVGKSRDTVFMGTVGYAPPEQYGFGQTDMRSDIYSIGMTLWFALTGEDPDPRAMPPGRLPPAFRKIIAASTDFSPKLRYPTVRHLLRDLEAARRSLAPPVPAAAPRPAVRGHRDKYGRLWIQLMLSPVHFVALVLTIGFLFVEPFRIRQGFGLQDNIVSVLARISVPLVLVFPPYILGFNLFHINDRLPFFKTGKPWKLVVLVLLLWVVEYLLIRFLDLFHTAAFLQAVAP